MANKSGLPRLGEGNVLTPDRPFTYYVDTTAVINLGNASESTVGSMLVNIIANGAVFSIVPQLQMHATAGVAASTVYSKPQVSAAEIAAGTAITASALIKIICDGADALMSVTMTSGTVLIEVKPVYG